MKLRGNLTENSPLETLLKNKIEGGARINAIHNYSL